MDFKKLADELDSGLGLVKKLAPLAKVFGGPMVSHVADIAAALAATGRNAITRVEEGAAVASEDDQAKLKKTIDQLAAVNDGLAAEIADS
jgi:hypothetical protein